MQMCIVLQTSSKITVKAFIRVWLTDLSLTLVFLNAPYSSCLLYMTCLTILVVLESGAENTTNDSCEYNSIGKFPINLERGF